jgi:drug/metabolite transporter (DMT)-like permease
MNAVGRSGSTLLPSLAIILSAILWGSLWIPLRQISAAGLSGVWAALAVYGAPLFFMLPLIMLRRGRLGKFGVAAFWVGATSGICNTFYAIGVVYGDVGKVVLLFYLNPIWSAILERLILKVPITRARLTTIAIGFSGMAVLVGSEGGFPLPHGLAEWFGVLASIFWALSLIGMALSGSAGIIPKTFFQFVFGLLTSAAILSMQWFNGDLFPQVSQLTAASPWILGAVILWIIPGMALSFWAVGLMSPTRAAILFMVEALVGVLSAALLTDEPFGWREIVGGLMILGAGLLDVIAGARQDRRAVHDRRQLEGVS